MEATLPAVGGVVVPLAFVIALLVGGAIAAVVGAVTLVGHRGLKMRVAAIEEQFAEQRIESRERDQHWEEMLDRAIERLSREGHERDRHRAETLAVQTSDLKNIKEMVHTIMLGHMERS